MSWTFLNSCTPFYEKILARSLLSIVPTCQKYGPAALPSLVVSNHSQTNAGNKNNNCNGTADHSDTKNNEKILIVETIIVVVKLIIIVIIVHV